MPVLLADTAEVGRLAAAWPDTAARLAQRYWPGALTIVVPARAAVPAAVQVDGTVALRVPGLPALRSLIARAGVPLIGTSANRSGQPPAVTAGEAATALANSVVLVLDGGHVAGAPSTVVLVDGDSIRVVREGVVPAAALMARPG
jgi:L-threonylcarbamoyladenylate synthase